MAGYIQSHVSAQCFCSVFLLSVSAHVTGPPGTNYAVMKKAFDEGWGGVIAKTVSVDSSKVVWQR